MKVTAQRRGEHTTYIELAAKAANILARRPEVTGISPGYIQPGKGGTRGHRKVKIADAKGCILLTVRQATSIQEVRVYTTNGHVTKLALARGLRNEGIPISFQRD